LEAQESIPSRGRAARGPCESFHSAVFFHFFSLLVPQHQHTRARCTGDDESAPNTRDSTRRRCTAHSKRHVILSLQVQRERHGRKKRQPMGLNSPPPPGVAARGPKTGAAVCVQEGRRSHAGALRQRRARSPQDNPQLTTMKGVRFTIERAPNTGKGKGGGGRGGRGRGGGRSAAISSAAFPPKQCAETDAPRDRQRLAPQ
jgi:hypothetical protein